MTESIKERLVKGQTLRVVSLDKLQVDPSYQRDIKGKVAIIIRDFDEVALGFPLIGEREDGVLWIVDGLQRVTALRKMGRKDVRCEVFRSEGPEHEAAIFKLINMNRTRLKPSEEFRALLCAHDSVAWEIKSAVERVGFRILLRADKSGKNREPEKACREITAISALLAIYKVKSLGYLEQMLPIIAECWPGDRLGTRREILWGATTWVRRYTGVFDVERLKDRLKTTTPHAVIYAAAQATISRGDRGSLVADQIEKVYRKRVGRKR